MNNEQIQRQSDVIFDNVLLEHDPIHVAGAALLLQNQSEDASVFSIAESQDGITFTAVLFATPAASGNATLSIVGGASAVVAFRSDSNFVRLQLAAHNGAGIRFHLMQFEPRDQVHANDYV